MSSTFGFSYVTSSNWLSDFFHGLFTVKVCGGAKRF